MRLCSHMYRKSQLLMFPIYVYMVIIFSGADIYMSSSSGMLPYPRRGRTGKSLKGQLPHTHGLLLLSESVGNLLSITCPPFFIIEVIP